MDMDVSKTILGSVVQGEIDSPLRIFRPFILSFYIHLERSEAEHMRMDQGWKCCIHM